MVSGVGLQATINQGVSRQSRDIVWLRRRLLSDGVDGRMSPLFCQQYRPLIVVEQLSRELVYAVWRTTTLSFNQPGCQSSVEGNGVAVAAIASYSTLDPCHLQRRQV